MERQTAMDVLDELRNELYDYIELNPADVKAFDMAKIALDVWDRMINEVEETLAGVSADNEAEGIALGLDLALCIIKRYLWEVEEGDANTIGVWE